MHQALSLLESTNVLCVNASGAGESHTSVPPGQATQISVSMSTPIREELPGK